MKSKVKYAVLTLALAITALGAMAFPSPRHTIVGPRPRYYVVRPYYYNPYWYDPFWYGPSWYAPPVYTVPRYLQGTIKTEIEPKNAEVYINGGYVGTANKFRGVFHGLNLRPGTYQLEFRAPNYQPLTMKVYVAADRTLKVKEHLRPRME